MVCRGKFNNLRPRLLRFLVDGFRELVSEEPLDLLDGNRLLLEPPFLGLGVQGLSVPSGLRGAPWFSPG